MSDVKLDGPGFMDASEEECPPTEPDPARQLPPRGAALSVLWWLEGDSDDTAS
ncbi:MAG: hypothetical protein KF819_24655 [Labilithrix sp.]|nr:hypothetical protein [Labilithrix sp.]